ncbi:MAG: hypothetical protein KF708_02140 [Pirellulales bacterium]|nr:hypothetical protein [Pirellulales bacterium]
MWQAWKELLSARRSSRVRRPGSARPMGTRLRLSGIESLERRRLLALTPVQFDQAIDSEVVGDRLFFSAAYESLQGNPGNVGVELWITDGTTVGTRLVKDIMPGLASSSPSQLTNVNGTLFFTARTPNEGVELWKSDGTAAGTVLVKDTSLGANSGDIDYLTNVNGTLFFRARGPNGPNALWVSNGTTAGTTMLKELYATQTRAALGPFVNAGGTVFFNGQTAANGAELWKSNGTSAGTVQVADIQIGDTGSGPQQLTNVSGTLFFGANDGIHGFELWKSNGTQAGTVLVKDIQPGSANVGQFANLNGILYFQATSSAEGDELWQSDGTSGGTVLVKDIVSGAASGDPNYITNVNGELYFRANNNLWSSDGSGLGTLLVSSVQPTLPLHFSGPKFIGMNGLTFFPGTTPGLGITLFKTNGTPSGTAQVAGDMGNPTAFTVFNSSLYLIAESDQQLLRTSGSDRTRILGLNPANTNNVAVAPFPYFDNFNRPDNMSLGGPWIEQEGDLRIVNQKVQIGVNSESIATLNGLSESDVSVALDYDLSFGVFGQSVGVVARYTGLGDQNLYMARVIRQQNNTYTADIWRNINGNYAPLASLPTSVSAGRLQLDVVGDRLTLYINGAQLVSVTDTTITGPGTVGIRQTGGTSDNFLVQQPVVIPPVNVTLPYTDTFNRANSPNIGPQWYERLGDLQILNNKLVQQFNSTAVVTLNGPNVSNVSNVTIQADIDLTTLAQAGSSLGLLGRYSGPGDSNAYMARLFRTATPQYYVQIWRNTGSDWEFLDQGLVGSGAGSLRFVLNGTSLEAYWNNILTVSVTDSTIAGPGLVGIRHAGGALDNFQAA